MAEALTQDVIKLLVSLVVSASSWLVARAQLYTCSSNSELGTQSSMTSVRTVSGSLSCSTEAVAQ